MSHGGASHANATANIREGDYVAVTQAGKVLEGVVEEITPTHKVETPISGERFCNAFVCLDLDCIQQAVFEDQEGRMREVAVSRLAKDPDSSPPEPVQLSKQPAPVAESEHADHEAAERDKFAKEVQHDIGGRSVEELGQPDISLQRNK